MPYVRSRSRSSSALRLLLLPISAGVIALVLLVWSSVAPGFPQSEHAGASSAIEPAYSDVLALLVIPVTLAAVILLAVGICFVLARAHRRTHYARIHFGATTGKRA